MGAPAGFWVPAGCFLAGVGVALLLMQAVLAPEASLCIVQSVTEAPATATATPPANATGSGRAPPSEEEMLYSGVASTRDLRRSSNPQRHIFVMWRTQAGVGVGDLQVKQFRRSLQTIAYYNPGAIVFFLCEDAAKMQKRVGADLDRVVYVAFTIEGVLEDTPLAGWPGHKRAAWRELSDVVRLAALYRWGGSWLDLDDLAVRPLPHVIDGVVYLEWPGVEEVTYWGNRFRLVPGRWKEPQARERLSGFHVQNDPILNVRAGNPFLEVWLKRVWNVTRPDDWGQQVPTDLLLFDAALHTQHVSLLPQHTVLLHPAFGNFSSKGPWFPPYDLRFPDGELPDYDTKMTEDKFWATIREALRRQAFALVKNSKFHGWSFVGAAERPLCGWLVDVDLERLSTVLDK